MKHIVMTALWIALLSGICLAEDKPVAQDQKNNESYSLGFQIGDSYRKRGLDMNSDQLIKGIRDGLSGTTPRLNRQEMQTLLEELKKKVRAVREAKRRKMAVQYRRKGKEFLAANAKKPGVVTLASGLQYKIIKEGTGKTPGLKDKVTVHYRGTFIDGTEFDSSFRKNEPVTFRVNAVIRGWTEALQLMKEGARWQLFIPEYLAYGNNGLLANRTLIFDTELISSQSSP